VVISGHLWSSVPFQRFLIELSVRPGMSFAISVQRDPSVAYARKMIVSVGEWGRRAEHLHAAGEGVVISRHQSYPHPLALSTRRAGWLGQVGCT
jgi:hypothetical protein